MRATRTLSSLIADQRKEWSKSNPSRLKYELGRSSRAFQEVADSPVRWVTILAILFVAGTFASTYWPAPYHARFNFGPTAKEYSPDATFLGLWAVQAALVAVVYPIVVAFVTVLIQRQAASKASLQAYFARSAAKLTGISSLSLVLVMALQFVILEEVGPLTGFAWLLADGAWFAVNTFFCIYFLSATFEFATPEGRTRARNTYILTKAWPEEWALHLTRLVALEPQRHGLLLAVPSAFDDLTAPTPAFSPHPGYFGTRTVLAARFRGAKEVVNIRYALLESAFQRWATRVASSAPAPGGAARQRRASLSRPGHVLEIGVLVFEGFSHETPLFRTNGSELSRLETALLRLSLSLSRRPRGRVVVLDALDEARQDAAAALQQDAVADFDKRLLEFLEFLDELIESSQFTVDGKADNWVLISSSQRVFGDSRLISEWLRAVTDLHSVALTAIERRGDFAERTVRVPARLFSRQEGFLCGPLKTEYTRLQYGHIRLLLDWAAERLPVPTPGSSGRMLGEPLKRRYDDLLKEAVGAWESVKSWLDWTRSDATAWSNLQEVAPHFELHLTHSASLVAACLRSEDRAGTYWFGDSFLQWRRQLQRYQSEDGVSYIDRFKVVYDDLLKSLRDFREQFPLPEYLPESDDTQQAAWLTGMGNMWKDVGLTLVATAVTRPSLTESHRVLSLQFIKTALGQPEGGFGGEDREAVVSSADGVIASLLRVHAIGSGTYSERIESLADSLVPSAVSEGVPGRVYGSAGTALARLGDGYLLLLAFLAPAAWQVSSQFDDAIRSWTANDQVRRRILHEFGSLRALAQSPNVVARLEPYWSLLEVQAGPSLSSRLDTVAAALDQFLRRVEAVRLADIGALSADLQELERVAEEASAGLKEPWNEAPLCLFARVTALENGTAEDQRAIRIFGWDKGTLTRPRMAEPAVNEGDYFRDVVRKASNLQIMHALFAVGHGRVQAVNSLDEFINIVQQFGGDAVAANQQPLLLVPSRVDPVWLPEVWRNRGAGPRLRPVPGHDDARTYVGHLGDVEVQLAPCPPGESVLCWRSTFDLLSVSTSASATAADETEPQRCTLILNWYQRAQFRLEAPVLRLQHRKTTPV